MSELQELPQGDVEDGAKLELVEAGGEAPPIVASVVLSDEDRAKIEADPMYQLIASALNSRLTEICGQVDGRFNVVVEKLVELRKNQDAKPALAPPPEPGTYGDLEARLARVEGAIKHMV